MVIVKISKKGSGSVSINLEEEDGALIVDSVNFRGKEGLHTILAQYFIEKILEDTIKEATAEEIEHILEEMKGTLSCDEMEELKKMSEG